ncbi:hypothetical protein ASF74_14720 [Arthrobacter sp. Leaf145]|nr:hypothetical protein ASF74_14720 [Arthrobacter sp. Leaf145]
MSAFVVLWFVVAAYVMAEIVGKVRALLLGSAATVTFGWSLLILAAATTSLGTLYMTGTIR